MQPERVKDQQMKHLAVADEGIVHAHASSIIRPHRILPKEAHESTEAVESVCGASESEKTAYPLKKLGADPLDP